MGLPEEIDSAYLEALFHAKYENSKMGKLPLARNHPKKVLIGKKKKQTNPKQKQTKTQQNKHPPPPPKQN